MSENVLEYQVAGAFNEATKVGYQPIEDLDRLQVSIECEHLIDYLTDTMQAEIDAGDRLVENDEDFRVQVLRESFVRVFEAGVRVGREEESVLAVTVHLTKDQVAGLVQEGMRRAVLGKE